MFFKEKGQTLIRTAGDSHHEKKKRGGVVAENLVNSKENKHSFIGPFYYYLNNRITYKNR